MGDTAQASASRRAEDFPNVIGTFATPRKMSKRHCPDNPGAHIVNSHDSMHKRPVLQMWQM
ncbi:hypothetical protein GCM10009551_059580 [Nocardiopsis tropica]